MRALCMECTISRIVGLRVLYPKPVYGEIDSLGNRTYWYATLCVYHTKRARVLEIISFGVFTAAVRKFFLNPVYTVYYLEFKYK